VKALGHRGDAILEKVIAGTASASDVCKVLYALGYEETDVRQGSKEHKLEYVRRQWLLYEQRKAWRDSEGCKRLEAEVATQQAIAATATAKMMELNREFYALRREVMGMDD
jgi:hypothetical protein